MSPWRCSQALQQQQQQQQMQAHLIAQAQSQQQQQQGAFRRRTESQTAGPNGTSFIIPPRTRTVSSMNEAPATAGLEGTFGSAKAPPKLNPNAASFSFGGGDDAMSAQAPKWRSVTSGVPSVPVVNGTAAGVAKHDAVTSWRRPSTKVPYGELNPSPTKPTSPPPPTLYVSTPDETSPPRSRSNSPPTKRTRPQPLHFVVPGTIADQVEADAVDASVVNFSLDSPSSPSTPTSGSSVPSSAREEASRRLYEGLGIGRPAPATSAETATRVMQPARQPRGPPSGVDELGEKNFASRIRRKAIGGLGVLMGARGRRSSMIEIEAF